MDTATVEQNISTFFNADTMTRLIVAVVLLILTSLLCHALVKGLKHAMNKDNSRLSQSSFLVNLLRFTVWGVCLSFILNTCFGVDMNALIAALGVGGIAISLGAQETISNFIGGIQIIFMRLIEVGDNIQVGSNKGVVQDVSWRHTTIKNTLGETVIIPNSVISKNAVTHLPAVEQVTVYFYVTTNRDLTLLSEEIINRTHAVADHLAEVEIDPQVLYTEIGEYGTKGKVKVTIDDPDKAVAVTDAVARVIAPLVCSAQEAASEEEKAQADALIRARIAGEIEETTRLKAAAIAALAAKEAAEAQAQEEAQKSAV